jgi:hypothetical protein
MGIDKRVKLKKECFKCYYFNKKLPPMQAYKCAVSWSCPGLNWDEKKKQQTIKRGHHGYRTG